MMKLVVAVCTVHTVSAIVYTPVGRNFYSTDAAASAHFYQRYLGAHPVPQNLTKDTSCAEVHSVMSAGIELTFIQDKVKSDGRVTAENAIDALTEQWNLVMNRKQLYSQWTDNHDGYDSIRFNADVAAADGLEMQVYHDRNVRFPAAVVRTRIPGTAWTLETSGNYTVEQGTKLEKWVFDDPDFCRNNSKLDPERPRYWWKATFAAADPAVAADFAVSVLGAVPLDGPYPQYPKPNCTYATWLSLPGTNNFMLHFVSSPEYSTGDGKLSIGDWAKSQEKHRNLSGGVFDRQMYNALVLWTDDLDPLIFRLEELFTPFLALKLSADVYAVHVDIPNNGFSIQVKGHKLTRVEPHQFDACGSAATRTVLV